MVGQDTYIMQQARPEWLAKTYIINIYFQTVTLEALAAADPDQFVNYRASVRELFRVLKPKIQQYKKYLGFNDEKFERYCEYMSNLNKFKALTFDDVTEWFDDLQMVLEKLGYTRFEKIENIKGAIKRSREG